MTSHKPALLISACLLGQPVRYDGVGKAQPDHIMARLLDVFELIPLCPEMQGGLPTPRPPAEIQHGDGRAVLAGSAWVKAEQGEDVTSAFLQGARQALETALAHDCRHALLKANSPSCGNKHIYDGSFGKHLRPGSGVAAALLEQNGICVWNETEIEQLLQASSPLLKRDD